MTPREYADFTDALVRRLASDADVLGVVALGSMASADYLPDEWSDHDFFVVVRQGTQERFREDLGWLPQAHRVVARPRETEHGVKAIYDDGHLAEFAVFDEGELSLARVNRYAVLLDRAGIASRMADVRAATERAIRPTADEPPTGGAHGTDPPAFGLFLANLLVGAARFRRGERLSGSQFVKEHATRHLLSMLAAHVESDASGLLDDLDPFRRFERVFPRLGDEVVRANALEAPQAALALLGIAERELAGCLAGSSAEAVAAVAGRLRTIAGANGA